jgi:hypothetical protein
MNRKDIKELEAKLQAADSKSGLEALTRALVSNAEELIARARAWEDVLDERLNDDSNDAMLKIGDAVIRWDEAVERNFRR